MRVLCTGSYPKEQIHTGHPNSKIHLFRENLKYIRLLKPRHSFTLCEVYIGMLM